MKANRSRPMLVWLVIPLLVAACAPAATPIPVETPLFVRIVGSDELRPLVEVVNAHLAQRFPSLEVEYEVGNEETGWKAIRQGWADIVLVSQLPDAVPADVWVQPVAEDALAVVTHPAVGVQGLSLEEVRDLFGGRVLTWEALGGPPLPVVLVSREEGSGARLVWERAVMRGRPLALSAVIMPGGWDVAAYVAAREGAVGYVSPALVRQHNVRVVALDGVLPSPQTVADGSYPVRRTWYLVVKQPVRQAARLWVETLASPEVRAALREIYAVTPLEPPPAMSESEHRDAPTP